MNRSSLLWRILWGLLERTNRPHSADPCAPPADPPVTPTESHSRDLLQSIDAGYCVIELLLERGRPVDYRFIELNAAFARHTGIGDALGKRVREISPRIEQLWIERFGRVALTGEPVRFERQALTLDGRWLDVHACRVGPPERLLVAVLFRDISDRKRIEQALRESEQRFRLLVESSAQAVWEADPDGAISTDSPSWRAHTGQSVQEWLGKGWLDAIHPDDRAAAEECWREAVRTHQRVSGEFRMREVGGGWRWTQVQAAPVLAPDGSVRKWVGMNIDITARKEAEEELQRHHAILREADRRKDEFLATLAHELRNPLAPIRNGLQILRLGAGQSDYAERTMAMMERQMTHLVRLVDDLLDVSRITRGKVELRRDTVFLDEVLAAALESSWTLMDHKGLQLVPAIAAETICVSGDFERLTQVFANLISNAVKYSLPEGKIWLELGRGGGEAVVRVRDQGAGIPAEALETVFEMFSQAHTQEHRAGGLGIGLALARQLVHMHGGTVSAYSEGLGHGSEFIVRLPLVAAPEHRNAHPARPVPTQPARALRILVADDNLDAAATLATMLELHGHTVRAVHDGLAALAVATEMRPDAALLDIDMPGLDGNEVARRLRALPNGATLRLVALTGWGQEEDRRRSLAAGFDEHLTKPVDPQVLRRVLSVLSAARPPRSGSAPSSDISGTG